MRFFYKTKTCIMIKINDNEFPKVKLLKLIEDNKIQAIMHVRGVLGIGLKEAKEVVENLEKNPDYYENIEYIKSNEYSGEERIIVGINEIKNFDIYTIDDVFLSKKELLNLIEESKLKAIKYLKSTVGIGLKEAKEIVDSLAVNPDYYKGGIIKTISSDRQKVEKSSLIKKKKQTGSHFIKEDNKNKKYFIFGVGFIIVILIYSFLN